MAAFVLIHGGAHGPWCWQYLLPHLEDRGPVLTIDLIEDALAAAPVEKNDLTIGHYIDGVVKRIEDADLQDVTLVGHSMAGITVPGVVHRIPQRIRQVIYLATCNPPVGQSVADLMKHPLSPLSRNASFEQMFCNDFDETTTRWLIANLRSDPPGPFSEPARLCQLPPNLPATYVVFEQDEALVPEFQLMQAETARISELRYFDAGHNGYISRPQELSALLLAHV